MPLIRVMGSLKWSRQRSAASKPTLMAPRRLLLLAAVLLALLAAAPTPAASAEVPGDQPSLTPDQMMKQNGTVLPGNADVYTVRPPTGTNPAITITMLPLDDEGDADLYCSKGNQMQPDPDTADFTSESISVNQDTIYIPPVDSIDSGEPVYRCAVFNRGVTSAPVSYILEVRYSFSNTSLDAAEQEVAQELFDRCCGTDSACWDWKLANDKAAMDQGVSPTPAANHSVVQTDLCHVGGVCSAGHLTEFNARNWAMSCDFPGDLFAKFKYLRALFLSWNEFTGDLKVAADALMPLSLEELGLYSNSLKGRLEDMCPLVQQGTLEMLQLGVGNDLSAGTVPACLFDGKSSLYVLGAAMTGVKGPIPDAFPASSHIQILDLAANKLTGSIPPSVAALPSLVRFTAFNNSLTGSIPPFSSSQLSVLMLDNNNLSGTVPQELIDSSTLMRLTLTGNPNLETPPSSGSSGSSGSSSSGGLSAGAIAGICVGVVLALAVAGGAAFWVVRRQRRRGPQTAAGDLKFAKFLDDEAALEAAAGPTFTEPATFYETLPGPASRPGPGGVELSGRPASGGI